MVKYEVFSFELSSKKEVRAQGIAEAMLDYLPWPTLDVKITWNPSTGAYKVKDNRTDFNYEVKLV